MHVSACVGEEKSFARSDEPLRSLLAWQVYNIWKNLKSRTRVTIWRNQGIQLLLFFLHLIPYRCSLVCPPW